MPANIAHMLIAHKALALLKTKAAKEFADFAGLLGTLVYAVVRLGDSEKKGVSSGAD